MAIKQQVLATYGGGQAFLALTYDDVLLFITRIVAHNRSRERTLLVRFTSPKAHVIAVAPGDLDADIPLAGQERMAYTMEVSRSGVARPVGLAWNSSFRI